MKVNYNMISIISAVKGRYDLTKRAFDSIWKNCSDEKNIEHLVIFDDGDSEMEKFVIEYSKKSLELDRSVQIHKKKYTSENAFKYRNMHYDYWNYLAKFSSGDIIFTLPNDAIIETKNYDKIMQDAVLANIKKYKHNYFQIFIDDGLSSDAEKIRLVGSYYCCWLVMTRPCLEIFNGIAPVEFSSDGADIFLARLFQSTDINAVIDLKNKIRTTQISKQKGNYDDDIIFYDKPVKDALRDGYNIRCQYIFQQHHYYHKLNNKILQSVFQDKLQCKR